MTSGSPTNSTSSSTAQLVAIPHVQQGEGMRYTGGHYAELKPISPGSEEAKNFFGRERMLEIGFTSWFACEAENRQDEEPEMPGSGYGLEPGEVCE